MVDPHSTKRAPAAREYQFGVVIRGCVEVSDGDLPRGANGRSLENRRLFHVGELVELPPAELLRLQRLGVVRSLR
jgi:hypothetical protein